MSTSVLYTGAALYTPDGATAPGWLLAENGRIAALGRGPAPDSDAERVDLAGRHLLPGLIDLHIHGALGRDTMEATPEALTTVAAYCARHGTTSFLATTMAAPAGAIAAALSNVAVHLGPHPGGAELLGAHLEGPYLDVERRGAQAPGAVRVADPAEYADWLASGTVRLLTVAPEFAPNLTLIVAAAARGVAVSLGHSRASYAQACRAVACGASQVTHLFNGMEPLHHRQPGLVGAALALDELTCQIIADNIHVHPAVLKLAVRAKTPQRIILITDAMSGAGMPDGRYVLGGQAVQVVNGAARLADNPGALAGSTLGMDAALRHVMAAAGLTLAEALPMATMVPARAIGLDGRKGSLAAGLDADLTVLDEALQVERTIVGGREVYRRG
jgi:N-acetylglucosamine-6-phosphate deacetylase